MIEFFMENFKFLLCSLLVNPTLWVFVALVVNSANPAKTWLFVLMNPAKLGKTVSGTQCSCFTVQLEMILFWPKKQHRMEKDWFITQPKHDVLIKKFQEAYNLIYKFLQIFFSFQVWPMHTSFLSELGPKITIFKDFTIFFRSY